MLPKIKLYDSCWSHVGNASFGSGSMGFMPTKFEWYRGNDVISDWCVVTENHFNLIDTFPEQRKVALIIESPASNPRVYEWIKQPENYNKFEYVLTLWKDMISISPKFHHYFFGGCWLNKSDRGIHNKSKNISIIASSKTDTEGHRLRHEVIRTFNDKIDGVFGNGYQFVQNKIDGLRDYRYHIIIENSRHSGWLSEKYLDAVCAGCLPIYYGAPDIGEYFNTDGILQFSTIEELRNILPLCTEEYYESKLFALAENFQKAQKYLIPEDLMWETFFKPKFFSDGTNNA